MSIQKFNSYELQLEILQGCSYKCGGCFVEKENDFQLHDKVFTVSEEFLQDLHPYAVQIGSTDIFVADNRLDVLADQRLRDLINRFDRLVVNSTLAFLDRRVAESIAELDVTLQVNMVVPDRKYLNHRYLQAIQSRVEEMRAFFPDMILHPQLNLSSLVDVENYEELNNLYFDYFGQGIDFNLSFARTQTDPQLYLDAFRWLRRVASTTQASVTGSMVGQHLDVVSPHDKLERAVVFYNNEFYAIPIVYEDLIQTKEKYRFDDYEGYKSLYDRQIQEQFTYAGVTEQCSVCPFLPACADHRVLSVMEDYGITECIMPLDTIKKVNRWEAA